ncbi:hypothetical protein [Humisphaera borealis]|uniref:Uncharacterized protein n=1 Tax=Humisphaera borealis TaxID=2807512 RepID=A0A7M2WRM5_9BACT|nr:hypothetical protein [Humisphaera borealis]QOV87461.1 hypothetical protein IPV69_14305 [Humisphaera borealis]
MAVSNVALAMTLVMLACGSVNASTYDGGWAGEQLRIDLSSRDGKSYHGLITKAAQQYPAQAIDDGQALTGTFAADGSRFDFSMARHGEGMVLRSGRAEYRLKRVAGEAAHATGDTGRFASSQPATREAGSGDPLAYRVLQFPGGTIARFDTWVYGQPGVANNVIWCDGAPKGREADFILRAAIGTPNAQDQSNLFVAGPVLVEQLLNQLAGPVFQRTGKPIKTTCGGDEAMILEYQATIKGKLAICRVMLVRRQDVAIAVVALGSDAGMKEFGRAIEIVAQSISVKEAAIEPGLVGTWVLENYVRLAPAKVDEQPFNLSQSRSVTLYPNGTFADTASTGFSGQDATGLAKGGSRGRVVKRGNVLTFRYDDGTNWSAPYELHSNGLRLDGKIYLKQ